MRFQLKAKTAEVKSILAAISTTEEAYFAEFGRYIAAPNQTGFTADAGADIDGNGVNQYWAIAKEASDTTRATAIVGCDELVVPPTTIAPCSPDAGQSVF